MQRVSRRRRVSRSTTHASLPVVGGARMYTLHAPIASTGRGDQPAGARYITAAKKAVSRSELLGGQKLKVAAKEVPLTEHHARLQVAARCFAMWRSSTCNL